MTFLPKTWRPRGACLLALLCLQTVAFAQIPVTKRPVNDAADDFHFAILPDRNGGMRPGVFEDAIAKTNLLQPAFVMSTGDLIDGYTTDPKVWDAQWQEFEAIVEKLQMPFYYVPGNHDVSNLLLLDAWKKRRGDPWFSFIYKNVLFMALNTEDRPFGGLGAEQIAWAKKTLADHTDVRWTLLFFHRPLWMEKNQAGYEQVRATLKGRNYTVFSGHLHHYLKGERDGMSHYVLATVGGDSKVRGKDVGEFDHITWVTMKSDGPVVVNLQLGGIVPDDVVTEEMRPMTDALRDGSWLSIEPVAHTSSDFSQLAVPLRLRNPTSSPLHVQGQLALTAGVRFEPATIDHVVPPDQTDVVPLTLVAEHSPISIHAFNESGPTVMLTGSYQLKGKPVALPAQKSIRLDWRHVTPRALQPISVDGDLAEWPADSFTEVTRPMYLAEGWDWTGPSDGRFRFAIQSREGKIFVAIETFDDHVITTPHLADLQDKLFVQIKTSNGVIKLEGVADMATPEISVRATPCGLIGEFAAALPAAEKTFHLNIGWQDHDRAGNTKPSILWWRDGSIAKFGEFMLAP